MEVVDGSVSCGRVFISCSFTLHFECFFEKWFASFSTVYLLFNFKSPLLFTVLCTVAHTLQDRPFRSNSSWWGYV